MRPRSRKNSTPTVVKKHPAAVSPMPISASRSDPIPRTHVRRSATFSLEHAAHRVLSYGSLLLSFSAKAMWSSRAKLSCRCFVSDVERVGLRLGTRPLSSGRAFEPTPGETPHVSELPHRMVCAWQEEQWNTGCRGVHEAKVRESVRGTG